MQATTLFQALQNVNGCSFIGFDSVTPVTLTGGKRNPLQGRVTKRMEGAQVMVFQNKEVNGYEAMIQRRLVAEGKDPASFELGPRAWGERMPNLPVVKHEKDGAVKHYLEVIFLRGGRTQYLVDGQPVERSEIEGLKESAEGAQGGLENKVVIRTFAVENITELRVNGQAYN
jgi:hypothetical protein